LLNKDEEQAAEDALRWLRGTDDVQEEMETLKAEDNMVKRLHTFTLKRIFTNGALKTPLTVCLVLNIGQQLCGINTVRPPLERKQKS
jgi:SP family facilitated glucose transporter-like MFS transporter 1